MNLVERWFSALTTKTLQRSAHRSATELAADITAWIETWNENPKDFVWTKTADQILDRLAGYCAAVTGTEYDSASSWQRTTRSRAPVPPGPEEVPQRAGPGLRPGGESRAVRRALRGPSDGRCGSWRR